MENSYQTSKKRCENCQQLFPEQKIDLHQAYCRRNIKKCNICSMLYDINEQEAHQKQFHSKKECKYCYLSFSEKQIDSHQPSCKRRPLRCQYCENDVAYEEFIRHQETCGARTSQCDICKKYISSKQMPAHKSTCFQRISPVRHQIPPRSNSREELRRQIRQNPFPPYRGQYVPQRVEQRQQQRRYGVQNYRQNSNREHLPSYQDPNRRNDRGSHQRIHVVSNQRPKKVQQRKPSIKVNFNPNLKPSHIIQPQRIRQMVDPVPISIRLAMQKSNKKTPLQNRN